MDAYLKILEALNACSDDFFFITDLQTGNIYFVSEVFKTRYDIPKDGDVCIHQNEWLAKTNPQDAIALNEDFSKLAAGEKEHHNLSYRFANKNGDYVWINCRGNVMQDDKGKRFLVGKISDTVLLNKVEPQTGLFNKKKLLEDKALMEGTCIEGFLMNIGIDSFRVYNLKNGWKQGNELLKNIAKDLQTMTAKERYQVYKLEDDRFAIFMPRAKKADVQNLFFKLNDELSKSFGITVSAGATHFENLPEKTEPICQYAEEALAKSKKSGKFSLSFFSGVDYERRIEETDLISEIEESIKAGFTGFSLKYQPQMRRTADGKESLFGAESLLRYFSQTQGLIMPSSFVPVLEKTGLIYPVGKWILDTALRQCKKWRERLPSFHMSVNFSYAQFKNPNLVSEVLASLEKSGLPGSALTLELTESIQITDINNFNKILLPLKEKGVEISIDDFGTGYSNFSYLKKLFIDEIKIDKSFVQGIRKNSYDYLILRNMMDLASSANIRVCCEGVERAEDFEVLKNLNPDLLQGYLFAEPCAKDDFENLFLDEDEMLEEIEEI